MYTGCDNPFAPNINYSQSTQSANISDLKFAEGVFQNLQYAYTFKDTLIYGQLLNPEFTFTYRDYDLGYDVSWGRQEEMRITSGLFQNSERLNLIWNNIVSYTPDSTQLVRGFDLTIVFNPSDVVRIDGRVNLQLKKDSISGKWQILNWNDESNF